MVGRDPEGYLPLESLRDLEITAHENVFILINSEASNSVKFRVLFQCNLTSQFVCGVSANFKQKIVQSTGLREGDSQSGCHQSYFIKREEQVSRTELHVPREVHKTANGTQHTVRWEDTLKTLTHRVRKLPFSVFFQFSDCIKEKVSAGANSDISLVLSFFEKERDRDRGTKTEREIDCEKKEYKVFCHMKVLS